MTTGNDPTNVPDIPRGLPTESTQSMRPPAKLEDLERANPQLTPTVMLGADIGPAAPLTQFEPSAYLLRREVAHGGYGEVWEAVQVTLNRVVAVKRPRTPHGVEPGSEEEKVSELLFRKEALVTAQLEHPNIVPVYDLGLDAEGHPLLSMKMVEGTAWNAMLAADRNLPAADRLARHLQILAKVARAVAYAHSRGIVHRDLKPEQVMVGAFGEVFLMDWGLAVAMPGAKASRGTAAESFATPRDLALSPAGTVAYMAPEQTESTAAKVGPWTDIFLLGGILYLVLTGTHPHPQPASAAAFMHAAHGFVEPPEERAPGAEIPGELGAVCMRALSRDPAQRHASALEFADEIDRYLWGANRRAESRDATDAARALLDQARGEYAPLEAADQHLQKALGLWGENPGALELQDRLFAEYADAALSRGDLRLAGVQAQRIAVLQRRESQVRRVEAAVHNARRQASRRRAAIVASILLSLLAAGLGAGIAVQVLRHRANQALQKTIQVEAREVSRTQELRAGLSNRERDRQQRIGRMREAAARFTEIAARDLPAPTHLEAAKDWAPAFLTANAPFEQSLAALESQAESERAALQVERVALEPPPYRYLLSRGYLGLARNTTDSIRLARELLTSASLQQPLRHEPVAATGVAEARLGDLDAADRILRKAQDLYSRQGRFYDDVRGLACDLDMLRWKRLPRRPGDLVVEASARGGQNRSHVRIISGRWLDNPASSQYKSTAPWLTSRDDASTTACIFYQPLIAMETSSPAVARFLPLAGRPVRYHVYVTWPSEANATPVHYRIRHADGDTTLALVQDGLGIAGESNANAWVALGEYEFLPGEDQFVEMSVGEEVRPLTPFRFGQANADAVLFAAEKLDIAARKPDLARDAPPEPAAGAMPAGPAPPDWSTDYEAASARAREEGRVLVAYVHYPVSAHLVHPVTRGREYCENRLFPHPAVAVEMQRACVAVRVNRMRRPDVAYRLGVADTETAVCIVTPDGLVRDTVKGDDILMSPVDFAVRLRGAAAAARPTIP